MQNAAPYGYPLRKWFGKLKRIAGLLIKEKRLRQFLLLGNLRYSPEYSLDTVTNPGTFHWIFSTDQHIACADMPSVMKPKTWVLAALARTASHPAYTKKPCHIYDTKPFYTLHSLKSKVFSLFIRKPFRFNGFPCPFSYCAKPGHIQPPIHPLPNATDSYRLVFSARKQHIRSPHIGRTPASTPIFIFAMHSRSSFPERILMNHAAMSRKAKPHFHK